MNPSELFIKRPVMTTLVMAGILIFGVMAYRMLPVSDLPNVDFPTISVSASLPGASPETMAAAVATPLEKQFSTIAGISDMTSTSTQGGTNITLQFDLNRNIDAAAQDVQAAISKTLHQLPTGIIPPSYNKVNPAASPIIYLALTSNSLALSALDEYGETVLGQRISTVPGVAQVSIYGAQKYAVRIQLDPGELASRRIGIDQVAQAVSNGNVNLPTGVLWGSQKAYTVEANGQLKDAQDFRRLIVSYRNGSPVRLQDLGRVLDDVQDDKTAGWYDNTRSIILAIQRQPGTNTVKVAANVRKMLGQLEKQIPASVQVHLLYDRSESIQDSVSDVRFTLLLTLGLVVMVIFLFLRNLSATIIPSLALPISIIGTFAVMYLAGYTLDNLSLMALTLAVGFVVDDAIVMLENIVRHMEMGKTPIRAALDGSRQIGFTILSMTLSLTAVFIPILLMGGVIGRLFHEFSVTIMSAILVSGVVSLTLTPMLSSRFLRPPGEQHHGRLYEVTEGIYQRALGLYERSLDRVMDHRVETMAFSAAILVGSVLLFVHIPKGFLPAEDTGRIHGTVETLEGTSFQAMLAHQKQVADIVAADPNVRDFMSFVGGGRGTMNQGTVFMHLKPRSERMGVDDVIKELNRKVAAIPGVRVFFQNPPSIRIGGRGSKSQYQFTLESPDLPTLYRSAQVMEGAMDSLPNLVNVTSDLQISNPQVAVDIDRDRAAALGVTTDQVERALYDAYGSRQVSTILTPTNQYWVVMELLPQFQRDPDALGMLYVRSDSGTMVPLRSVATLKPRLGPLTVSHAGQVPSVTVSFDLGSGTSLGTAVSQIRKLARVRVPSTVNTTFSGTAAAFQSSQQGLLLLLVLAVLVIYLVLGILYESFIHPITILSGLPFAAFGALLTLLVFHVELSVYAYVGIIMLIGLVKKNAIMMIDFALEAERSEGASPRAAILEACSVRFRPIMMTTMAALMATLPIAIGFGAGSESRRPLGLAVVGGLLFSQLITLYVTPVVYTYLDSLQKRLGLWGTEPVPVGAGTAEAHALMVGGEVEAG
ncbi:MAG: efflux RND transporter permease subunit [Candidatus Palauibacterales bacterium]|nr:efflux RND transporter permease subunit [Candidatus Palauibacterales bacterium]MDP2529911.1 efflux RND transporter permease subunit [Candidatus Palauibacterales bacterium]MDP2583331.1 efflux RND transporter permease subunit [Candidatus Palauibacterales bacterium]